MKKIFETLPVIFLTLAIITGCEAQGSQEKLQTYEASINYTCTQNSDCTIKNVGNCCGGYPKCTNKNAQTNPALVKKLCTQSGMAGICGFPSIESCECVNNKCEGVPPKL